MNQPKEIFAGKHNPSTIIRVIFGRAENDNSVGLDVVLSGRVVARFFRPEDVTAWFAANSKKLLENWRSAYHKSGLTPESYKKPAPKDFVLDVPYLSQRDNLRNPLGTCNVTSYAMCLEYFGAPRKYPGKFKQFEDELSYFLEDVSGKDRHLHSDLAWLGRQYGIQSSFATDRTWAEIRSQLRGGNPVIVSGLFTSSGHIVVIVGLKGEDFVVNDPYGNALSKSATKRRYANLNGERVLYPFDYMNGTVRQAGRDQKWAHFLRRNGG